jgi:hypothetical protein
MIIQKRTMNWLPKLSAYDYARQQTARRRAMAKDFLERQQNMAAVLGSVGTVNSQSAVKLSIDQAVQRILASKKKA